MNETLESIRNAKKQNGSFYIGKICSILYVNEIKTNKLKTDNLKVFFIAFLIIESDLIFRPLRAKSFIQFWFVCVETKTECELLSK